MEQDDKNTFKRVGQDDPQALLRAVLCRNIYFLSSGTTSSLTEAGCEITFSCFSAATI